MTDPRVVIAGTGSGVGKTTISCAVIRGFNRAGYVVRPFKAGPDYIDPGYLKVAAGRDAINLDVWMMGQDGVMESLARNSGGMAAVIEGVMGYYDGLEGGSNRASTHHIASITKTPVILVVDASGSGRSVAATVLGFMRFSHNSMVCGVILNRIGSARHTAMCRDALQPLGVKVLGAVPRKSGKFKSRHLGLVPPMEDTRLAAEIITEADRVLDSLDMDGILDVARQADELPVFGDVLADAPKTRLGVALDGSFNFYYQDNMARLREAGGDLVFFSPETAETIPDVDGLYVGGGFPEVRAALLEKNKVLMNNISDAVSDGMPIYAECGGLMYLAKCLMHDGKRYGMVGAFDMEIKMTARPTLNYTKGIMARSPVSHNETTFRGHEFHYSQAEVAGDATFAQKLQIGLGIRDQMDGIMIHNTMASYGHLYLSNKAARTLVENCITYSRR